MQRQKISSEQQKKKKKRKERRGREGTREGGRKGKENPLSYLKFMFLMGTDPSTFLHGF